MAIMENKSSAVPPESKRWGLFKLPFRNTTLSLSNLAHNKNYSKAEGSGSHSGSESSVSLVARSLLRPRHLLKLDPSNKLYFPHEPGKQVRSAIKIRNSSKSHVAFKFQTTAPKSCFMRPPGAILAPGESIIATVFKFIEPPESNEKPLDRKCPVKFKIISLKVKDSVDYVPELFNEPAVEQILKVVFLNMERSSPALDKLNRQLAEADSNLEARKKTCSEDIVPRFIGEGLVIDEWKERREKYISRQQEEEGPDSM